MARPHAEPTRGAWLVLALAAWTCPGAAHGADERDAVYPNPPMAFEVNQGQSEPEVAFLARGRGYTVFLAASEAVLSLSSRRVAALGDGNIPATGSADRAGRDRAGTSRSPAVVRMRPLNANPTPALVGFERLPGVSNYLIGNDPARWHTTIPQYGRVEYRDLYPGVDLAFYGDQGALEYDFVVSPGADPGAIRLSFEGVTGLRLDDGGNLILEVEGAEIVQKAPVSYQTGVDGKAPVRGRYVLLGDCDSGFALEDYDRSRPLVIDPVLVYSTYLGGMGMGGDDGASGIAVDGSGNAYVTGYTASADFPTANPLQSAGAPGWDAFVAKLDSSGSALIYSTFLGGRDSDQGSGIAVDGADNAYVTGSTVSNDFPTANPVQAALADRSDAFALKLNAAGSALVYSTYLGGSEDDYGTGVAVDGTGNAFLTGDTCSTDFPTVNPLQPANAGGYDAFIAKLDPAGSALVYLTYLGGSDDDRGKGIAVDGAGNPYVTGETISSDFPLVTPVQPFNAGGGDAFLAAVNSAGSALVYGTYLGGTSGDYGNAIAVDGAGNAYITGETWSADFPTANPLQPANAGYSDAFVARLAPVGPTLTYSTYLGGSGYESGYAIGAEATGSAYVTGGTDSPDFPTANAFQPSFKGRRDGFIARLSPGGAALVYSTYLGGNGDTAGAGIAVDAAGSAYVAGSTDSTDFPTVNALQTVNAGRRDAIVAKLNPAGAALVYSTYLGGSPGDDGGSAVAVDESGNAYVTGFTASHSFPTAIPAQSQKAGREDAFVSKLDATGSAFIYSTYLGGSLDDHGTGITVDGSGNAYVTGDTWSTDFPTAAALQPANGALQDAFVLKLNPAGSGLVYSTYLGGSDEDRGSGIALDGAGNVYATGITRSPDFPTANPLQPFCAGGDDAFLVKMNSAGSSLVYSTYLGGSRWDEANRIAVDAAGSAYVTGLTQSDDFPTANPVQPTYGGGFTDAFVAELDPTGSVLVYSTYLGGRSSEYGRDIAVDVSGSAYVVGGTDSPDFPTANPLQPANAGGNDAFLAKLNSDGSSFVYSTYLGGIRYDAGWAIAVDGAGATYIAGDTHSPDFPTLHPIQAASASPGYSDVFVTKVNPAGSALVYSTYLGGDNDECGQGIAVDGAGSAYVTGDTQSVDFPTSGGVRSTGVGDFDAFVVKLPGCAAAPARVARLMVTKVPPSDVLVSWDLEPLSVGGYHVYTVDSKLLVPAAGASGSPTCTAPAGQADCTHTDGLPPPPDTVFYQVVGVCADGFTEGPI